MIETNKNTQLTGKHVRKYSQKNAFQAAFASRVHNLPARVCPRAKLEIALLVVEGKPSDVDLARRLKTAKGQYVVWKLVC